MQQGTGSRKCEIMGFLSLIEAGLETKNVFLFLIKFFVSLILQANELTVILQYPLFNNQSIPFLVPTQTMRILLDCLVLVLPKGNAWKGVKRFVAVSYLAFKRLIFRLVSISFLRAISARSWVFSTSYRGLVHSIICCVIITQTCLLARLYLICTVHLIPN